MIIYLSGPMTGLPEFNFPLFNKWAKYLRDHGHQVLNPAENDGGSQDKPRQFYLELDISNVLVCEAIVLLPGWEYSEGSKLEISIAQAIGRKIYELEEFIAKKYHPIPFVPKIRLVVEKT